MATVLYPSPIFGPVKSRRLGVSLGINLIPADGKMCSFDCLYCECGRNAERLPHTPRPPRSLVAQRLEEKLCQMKMEGELPDVITFAGNGEPTMHPAFADIIEDTIRLRGIYCPEARVAVLSNALHCGRPKVQAALRRVDDAILKLDTVDEEYIRLVDRPDRDFSIEEIIENIAAFEGQACVQTMFMTGQTPEGYSVDNTSERYVLPWIDALRRIRPRKVMIYTIDRETPTAGLQKAAPETLDGIAALVREVGLTVEVSY